MNNHEHDINMTRLFTFFFKVNIYTGEVRSSQFCSTGPKHLCSPTPEAGGRREHVAIIPVLHIHAHYKARAAYIMCGKNCLQKWIPYRRTTRHRRLMNSKHFSNVKFAWPVSRRHYYCPVAI